MSNPISDLEQSGCLLVIGSNTTETHPIVALRIKKAVREHGAVLIVANPKYIDLCDLATVWLRHRPGTDVALVNGIARIILEEGLWNSDFVASRTEGFQEWRDSLSDYTPARVAEITGVSPDDLYAAARHYACPPHGASAIIYTLGLTLHRTGTDNVLSLANLAMLTGNMGMRGGGLNPLRGQNNVQGACDMGCLPDYLPGYQKVSAPEVRAKFAQAWGREVPGEPGLTSPEMVEAILAGDIKAMYILGENPVVSEADAGRVTRALESLEFLVVQEIFLSPTAELAHVVLPGVSFAEKEGTFTNTERRVQLVRQAIQPIGGSRPDWQIICDVAQRVARARGLPDDGFAFGSAAAIMDEIARVTPSYGGISHARLEKEKGGLQWPCPTADHPGTPILHVGKFVRGLGRFTPVEYIPPAELPDRDYPFVLTTGRSLYHYHTGTMTRRVAGLNRIVPEAEVEVNPADAQALGLVDGGLARVSSRRGQVVVRVKATDKTPLGVVFMTFHFAEARTNLLTSPALDPIAKAPELKVCAVRVERA